MLKLSIVLLVSLLLIAAAPILASDRPATSRQAATPPPTGEVLVYAEAIEWLNVRYGPSTDYPRLGTISKGQQYRVLRTDPQRTWLEIEYPNFVGGRGWVYRTGVIIMGNLNDLPITTETTEGYPTLTATPPMIVTSAPVWDSTPISPLNTRLGTLSQTIYDYLLSHHFDPATDMLGSVFVMDLQTGERYSINPGVAYSGMSLIKLPILVSFYRRLAGVPTYDQAASLALMIICSENLSTNHLLSWLGEGDAYRGAAYVTETMRLLGLHDTFLAAPLATDQGRSMFAPTVPPIVLPVTSADQVTTRPDPYNQTTPSDLGWLLAGLYQCAVDGTGPLPSIQLTAQKCRAVLRVLRADDIPAMLRAGIPNGVSLARKHGWVDEVHGDAGLFSSIGGDYVLVVMLRNRTWLNYEDSFPVIAEISRMAYNTFNPADPLVETHTEPVPQCSLGSLDPQLIPDLLAGNFPPLH